MDILALIMLLITMIFGGGFGNISPGGGTLFATPVPLNTPTPSYGDIGRPTQTPQPGTGEWTQILVEPGKTVSIPLKGVTSGQRLTVLYEVAQHDIRAYVNFPAPGDAGRREQAGICADESSEDSAQQTQWYELQECRTKRGSATVTADAAGEYRLVFDNSYSWFQAKKIRYKFHRAQ